MALYKVIQVHPIAGQRHTEYYELPSESLPTEPKAMARLLRDACVLMSGQRVTFMRPSDFHGQGGVVVFPSRVPGGAHSIILVPAQREASK